MEVSLSHIHAYKDEFWRFQHFLSESFDVNLRILYCQCVLVKIKFKKLIIINTTLRGAKVLHQCISAITQNCTQQLHAGA